MIKKIHIFLFIAVLLASACQSNNIYVHNQPDAYNQQLSESLKKKDFKTSQYILEHPPANKTLDYHKYLVTYHHLTNTLPLLEKVAKDETNPFIKNYLQGLMFAAKGIYYFEDALKSFYEASKYQNLYQGDTSLLYYNIAIIEIKKEDHKASLENINKAIELKDDESYIVLKAYILMKEGKYLKVQKLLNTAFKNIQTHRNILKASQIMNTTFNALKPMPKELKEAYIRWLNVAQSGKHLQVVLRVSKEGMMEYPEHSEMYTLAGLAHYLLDNKGEAVSYFNKAIKIDESKPFNYIQMGIIYWNLKQQLKAEEYFSKAVKLNKYSPIAYSYLSRYHKNLGNLTQAITLKKYQIKFMKDIDTEMELFKLYKKEKNTLEMRKQLDYLIKRFPNDKRPYKEYVYVYDILLDEENNPNIKMALRKKQLYYEEKYREKDEEESKKRLVTAEIENNGKTKK